MRNSKKTSVVKKVNEEIDIQTTWDMLEFAKSYTSGIMGGQGVFTPDLLNSRMKDISFNPQELSENDIVEALKNPKNNESTLRSIVEYLEIASMPFRRIMSYQHSQLAFDLTWTVDVEQKDYKKDAFKKQQKQIYDFVDNFDYKGQFRIALKQMLRNEVFICSPRQQGTKLVLQELPIDRCRITGRWDYGLLIDFDFTYFLQPGVSLDMYHPWFKKRFYEVFNGDYKRYDPSLPINRRGENQFAMWVAVEPQYAWCFKFDPSIVTQIPYYSSLVPEFMSQAYVRALQKSQYTASSAKVLFGAVPLLKDQKTTLKDALAISPEVAGKFLALVKSALGDAIKVATAPMEDTELFSVDSDNDQYSSYLQTAVSSSGVNTPLVFSGKQKANALESQLSWFSDYLIMDKVYPQFNNFMNFFGNKVVSNYKWSFEFEGSDYYLDRDRRLGDAMTLAGIGIVLPQKISAAIGMPYHKMLRMLDESDASGFVDRLKPIQMASQMSAEAQSEGKGRPKTDDSKLSDGGSSTRDTGGNIGRGGKV